MWERSRPAQTSPRFYFAIHFTCVYPLPCCFLILFMISSENQHLQLLLGINSSSLSGVTVGFPLFLPCLLLLQPKFFIMLPNQNILVLNLTLGSVIMQGLLGTIYDTSLLTMFFAAASSIVHCSNKIDGLFQTYNSSMVHSRAWGENALWHKYILFNKI